MICTRQVDYAAWTRVYPLINNYAEKWGLTERGQVKIKLPINVALTVWFLGQGWTFSQQTTEEILATGITPIQKLLSEAGFPIPKDPLDLMHQGLPRNIADSEKQYYIMFAPPNKILLNIHWARWGRFVAGKIEEITPDFLRKIREGKLSEAEKKILAGLCFLSEKTQMKYLKQLAHGNLTLRVFAEKLHRAAYRYKSMEKIREVMSWLQEAGFPKMAGDLLIKTTLISGGKHG